MIPETITFTKNGYLQLVSIQLNLVMFILQRSTTDRELITAYLMRLDLKLLRFRF